MTRNGLVGGGASGIADLIASAYHDHMNPGFGTMSLDSGSGLLYLLPDSMPGVRIPAARDNPGGYRVLFGLQHAEGFTIVEQATDTAAETNPNTGPGSTDNHTHVFTHTHNFQHGHLYPDSGLQDQERVLIIWADNTTPVVIGRITN